MNEDKLEKLYKRIEKAKSLPPAELKKYVEALAGIYADIAKEENNKELEITTICCYLNVGISYCFDGCDSEVANYIYSVMQSVDDNTLHKLTGIVRALQMLSEEGGK